MQGVHGEGLRSHHKFGLLEGGVGNGIRRGCLTLTSSDINAAAWLCHSPYVQFTWVPLNAGRPHWGPTGSQELWMELWGFYVLVREMKELANSPCCRTNSGTWEDAAGWWIAHLLCNCSVSRQVSSHKKYQRGDNLGPGSVLAFYSVYFKSHEMFWYPFALGACTPRLSQVIKFLPRFSSGPARIWCLLTLMGWWGICVVWELQWVGRKNRLITCVLAFAFLFLLSRQERSGWNILTCWFLCTL